MAIKCKNCGTVSNYREYGKTEKMVSSTFEEKVLDKSSEVCYNTHRKR